ncbi:MAG: phosphatase [Gammaproteobacteria bacterium]|nr:phosphatase [Gammaproteobacteria bacterium]|tara:strand:+ start:10387 stop:10968 length:582 start_codon:yes stop_codon:yes gene_type:complete
MTHLFHRLLAAGLAVAWAAAPAALEPVPEPLAEVVNFRQYDPLFASAGQPTREQFGALRDAGFDRVVYLAFSNSRNALPDEDVVVKGLGMDYLHVPVDWEQPRHEEFETFAAYMRQSPASKTLLHCVVNARATAFSFLYRVIYQDVPVAQAKADMNTVWQPTETWRDFIFEVLARHGRSPDCDGCDWTPMPEP